MKHPVISGCLAAAFAAVTVTALAASLPDDDDDDHNRASRAVGQGRALPLTEILKKVQARLGGEVIGVEFKGKRGFLVCKLKVVTPAGRLSEISVDATTGDIVMSKEDD